MNVVNAIAKIRFNSARPQRVQLGKSPELASDLLCLEPNQKLAVTGQCLYYVIAGNGELHSGDQSTPLTMGHFAVLDRGESHTLVNTSEQRLICLTICRHR